MHHDLLKVVLLLLPLQLSLRTLPLVLREELIEHLNSKMLEIVGLKRSKKSVHFKYAISTYIVVFRRFQGEILSPLL